MGMWYMPAQHPGSRSRRVRSSSHPQLCNEFQDNLGQSLCVKTKQNKRMF